MQKSAERAINPSQKEDEFFLSNYYHHQPFEEVQSRYPDKILRKSDVAIDESGNVLGHSYAVFWKPKG
jgi:hypothetical protein